jgi:hypothetical protein
MEYEDIRVVVDSTWILRPGQQPAPMAIGLVIKGHPTFRSRLRNIAVVSRASRLSFSATVAFSVR